MDKQKRVCVCVCVFGMLSSHFFFFISSTASNSPRSTPGSSPSLRRRVLGGSRANESEAGGEKSCSGGGGGSDSPLPSIPSASSLSSAYPLAARHFTRNAKVTDGLLNVLCSGVILKITTAEIKDILYVL